MKIISKKKKKGKYEKSSQDLQAATGLAGSVRQEVQLRQQLCDSLLHLQQADAVIQQWDLMQQAVDSGGGRGNWSLEQQVLWLNNRAYQVAVSSPHLRAHETEAELVCRLLLEKKKNEMLLVT